MNASYDSWKTRSDLDDWAARNHPEERLSQCDCCGKMKYGCRDLWVSYAGDTHACPGCLGEDEE